MVLTDGIVEYSPGFKHGMTFLENTLALYLEAAPWLVFGLVAAGLLKAWIPDASIERMLGGTGFTPIAKAALIGAPLPLCSCGVLPAALGLKRSGASNGATVSFLIATPETGPDSVALSYALLGPFMAVVRPVAAICSALLAGILSAIATGPSVNTQEITVTATSSCDCGNSSCVDLPVSARPMGMKLFHGIRYALTDILDDITLWLLAGILLAAAVMTFLPPMAIAEWGSGLPTMLLMLVVGIPMYICATASTPLAAALLLAGVSPGSVLVFLLAGPATNVASIGVVKREMGFRVLAAYLTGISVAAISMGLATDHLVQSLSIDIGAQLAAETEWLPEWLVWSSGILFAAVAVRPLRNLLLPSLSRAA